MTSADNKQDKPVILVIAGHDPGGGAGVQADIESILANGCRPVSIISCLTAQNRHGIKSLIPQNADDLKLQLKTLTSDTNIDCIKIGALGNLKILAFILEWLDAYADIPLVVDPVLKSSSKDDLLENNALDLLREELIPRADIITPNTHELMTLANDHHSIHEGVNKLHENGCKTILVTGTHETGNAVINRLFIKNKATLEFEYERLSGEFHGSGCTLASALASQMMFHDEIEMATKKALDYTFQTLSHAVLDDNLYGIPKRIS